MTQTGVRACSGLGKTEYSRERWRGSDAAQVSVCHLNRLAGLHKSRKQSHRALSSTVGTNIPEPLVRHAALADECQQATKKTGSFDVGVAERGANTFSLESTVLCQIHRWSDHEDRKPELESLGTGLAKDSFADPVEFGYTRVAVYRGNPEQATADGDLGSPDHDWIICPRALSIFFPNRDQWQQDVSGHPSNNPTLYRNLKSLFSSRTCRAFNDRSTVIYLERTGLTFEDFKAGAALNIESYCLPALMLPTSTPQLKTLVCRFTAKHRILRDLRRLRIFLAKCHSIEVLKLSFHHADDMAQNPTSLKSQTRRKILVTELSHISREMAGKTAGPVFMVPGPNVYKIGSWGGWFGSWSGSPGRFGFLPDAVDQDTRVRVVGVARLVWENPPFWSWSRKSAICINPANPNSVLFRRIPVSSRVPRPFTLIAFDMESMWWFELGRQARGKRWSWDAAPSELATILPYLRLPKLQRLTTHESIDPVALGAFVRRHPRIMSLHDYASGASAFLNAPVRLPWLTELSCKHIRRLAPLLNALDRAPGLARISIPFQCHTPEAAAAFAAALRRLSASPLATPSCLVLNLDFDSELSKEQFDALPAGVARRMHAVDWLHVRCTTLAAARALVPGIALFPALQQVDFEVRDARHPSGRGRSKAASVFLRETRVALKRVPEVSLILV
ncbi:hypothetical protein C8R47DRAFT_1204535 [Mycena vitilis]|nr:hypothetical protein C8R47DRAFT_1204535 [Mycena vitilis]